MDMQYELEQCENAVKAIVDALYPIVKNRPYGPEWEAYIQAWRIMMRFEEQRNRHPY